MDINDQLLEAQGHLNNQRLREALQIYQAILEQEPGNSQALKGLGQLAFQVANFEAAEDYLQKSLMSDPAQYPTWLLLAEVNLKNRRYEQALEAIRKASDLQPDVSEPLLRMGNVHRAIGNEQDAQKCFENAFMMDRSAPSAFRLLATSREIDLGSDLAKRARERLQDGLEDVSGRAHIHYGFAYIHERKNNREKFFEHLLEANRLQKSQAPSWQRGYEFNNASLKKHFTPELFERAVPETSKEISPVFIVGMPRSGTTLTEQIIASHPEVFGADEVDTLSNFVVNRVAVWTQKPFLEGVQDLNPAQLQELSLIYQKMMGKLSPGAQIVTDKYLANYLSIGLIRLIMPWSRVVALERHPMDIALSMYRNFFLPQLAFCFDLEDIARFYCLYREIMDFWHQLLPDFIKTVKYENLVQDIEGEAKELVDYCGLPWDPACATPHKTERGVMTLSQDQVRKPVYKTSVGKWKNFEKELKPFKDMCEKLGYPVENYE